MVTKYEKTNRCFTESANNLKPLTDEERENYKDWMEDLIGMCHDIITDIEERSREMDYVDSVNEKDVDYGLRNAEQSLDNVFTYLGWVNFKS